MNVKDFVYGFYAKSRPLETIGEHTEKLLRGFREFCALYGRYFSAVELELIELAAQYHDFGKINYLFQKKICSAGIPETGVKKALISEIERQYRAMKDGGSIPHGYFSPAFLDLRTMDQKYGRDAMDVLIFSIYQHHARDTAFTSADISEALQFDIKARMPEGCRVGNAYLNRVATYQEKFKEEKEWLKYAVIKGMLNRLDYWASASVDTPVEIEPMQEGKRLCDIIEEKLLSEYGGLREVQEFTRMHAGENLIVVASTGVGKTEAALLWAGGEKTFYTLPLKVSINAIYERVRKRYLDGRDKVSLLHSDALSYLLNSENEGDDALLKYQATRLFSYPLTICTVDQLFSFVYKAMGSEILLSTLKYSKLIIDEIQAYSPDLVAKIIYGLKLITEIGGRFAIITATMPPVFEHFLQKYVAYAHSSKPFLSKHGHRHYIKLVKGDFDFEIIKKEGKTKKVLVICNTVAKSQAVYEKLKEDSDVHLLHSHFIRIHRKKLEDRILSFTKEQNRAPGIWVSTQIVEASLDISFDMLFTEMCTADSLLQRLGRCFRQKDYTGNMPNVIIYDTGNGVAKSGQDGIYDYDIYRASVEALKSYDNGFFTEEMKMDYINRAFDVNALKNTDYYKKIDNQLKSCEAIIPGIFSEQEARKKLRDILSVTVIPESVYNEYNKNGEIDDWISIITGKGPYKEKIEAMDKLYSLTFSLYPYSTLGNKRDRTPIATGIDIYRIPLPYEFDEIHCKGKGLYGDDQNKGYFIFTL